MITAKQARRLLGAGTVLATLFSGFSAQAHKATERYIPLGLSPGISHNFTVVGKIEAINTGLRSVTFASPSGTLTVEIPKDTKIWVDRTKLKQTNLNGSFGDLKTGRTIEVKFLSADLKRTVDWVKVDTGLVP